MNIRRGQKDKKEKKRANTLQVSTLSILFYDLSFDHRK